MNDFIDGYNFKEMEPMKYFAPPSTWDEEKKKNSNIIYCVHTVFKS